jgi:hypothetical protein
VPEAPSPVPSEYKLYERIAAGLEGQQEYTLVFGISCLLMLSFGGFAVASYQQDPKNTYIPLVFVVVAVLCVVISMTALMLVIRKGDEKISRRDKTTDPPGGPGPSSTNNPISPTLEPYLQAIEAAIDNVSSLAKTRLIKEDLSFEVTFLRYVDSSKKLCLAKLAGSYRVRNFGDEKADFRFLAQVDVAETMTGAVDGDLYVRNLTTGEVLRDKKDKKISFISERSAAGLSHIFRDRSEFQVLSGHALEFRWTTSEFEIRMPYCEFFTTSQPVFNMAIRLVNKIIDSVAVKAEVFRSAEVDTPVPRPHEGATMVEVNGVFLPFQGVLVRLYPLQEDDL